MAFGHRRLFLGLALASCLATPQSAAAKPVQIPSKYVTADGRLAVPPASVSLGQTLFKWGLRLRHAFAAVPAAALASPPRRVSWREVTERSDLAMRSKADLAEMGNALLETPLVDRLTSVDQAAVLAQFDRILTAHGNTAFDKLSILSEMGVSESDAPLLAQTKLRERIASVYADARAAIEGRGLSPAFYEVTRKLGMTTAPGTFTPLHDGPTTFTRVFDLMEQAVQARRAGRQAFVFNATYEFVPDSLGTKYGALLRRLARAGGQVYSLYEPAGSHTRLDGRPFDNRLDLGPERTLQTREDGTRFLPQGTADSRSFFTRIASPKGSGLGSVQLAASAPTPLNRELNHCKTTAIGFENDNGQLEIHVINGDMNNNDEYLLLRGFSHEITGPAVTASLSHLVDLWNARAAAPLPEAFVRLINTPQAATPDMVPISTITHRGKRDVNLGNVVLATIDAMPSTGRFIAAIPYNYNLDEFHALARAALRVAEAQARGDTGGHPPVLLVPVRDHPLSITAALKAALPSLIKAGVDIRVFNDPKYLDGSFHSKRFLMVYKDRDSLGRPVVKGIGSNGTSNLDRRSLFNNWEENQLVTDQASLRALGRSFAVDLSHSTRVRLDERGRLVFGGKTVTRSAALVNRFFEVFQALL